MGRLLGLFDSVTLGIVLLIILFVYCTVGSAGIFYPEGGRFWSGAAWTYAQLRTFRGLEMTEYEWFNWWPFGLLMGLICVTIIVVTLRRIRLNTLNLGVWMIHTGIIILCLASAWYFGTKVEGDTPVVRRQVSVQLPAGEPNAPGGERSGHLPAIPGAGLELSGWRFDVVSVNPDYTMLSGPDEGGRDYSVTVSVVPPAGESFMRQLLAQHPENTEDVVRTGDPSQPMMRAIKAIGTALVDEELGMRLDYLPQEHFYLANWVEKSWALYVREVNADGMRGEWAQRPLEGMPLYNDYVTDPQEVWLEPGESLPADPLRATASAQEEHDVLGDVELRITSYLRYATLESRRIPGGAELDPFLSFRMEDDQNDAFLDVQMAAFRPEEDTADVGVGFVWVNSLEERAALIEPAAPRLYFQAPGMGEELEVPVREVSVQNPALAFRELPGTSYEYRVEFVQDLRSEGVLASVELRTPDRHFRRWVFDPEHASRTMDVSLASPEEHDHDDHSGHTHAPNLIPEDVYALDPGLSVRFEPGNAPPRVLLVAGPEQDALGVALQLGSVQDGAYVPLQLGEPVSLGGGRSLTVLSYAARSHREQRPAVVPLAARNRDARERRAMARFEFAVGGRVESSWLTFHEYVFDEADNDALRFSPALRRYPFAPTAVDLADGRRVELMLSRQRRKLPEPVVLDDFELSAHIGGYSGQTNSIQNWTSQIRFLDEQGAASERQAVTVNAPAERAGLWYFQAAWDPPEKGRFRGEPDSNGLNYTVLGVGNRNGVVTQLVGCTIAVLGMLYAFYVKPVLVRRRRRPRPQGMAGGKA